MSLNYLEAVNRLTKWRSVFAGRWLGTRASTDPETIAVRDVVEKLLILRAEVNALIHLATARGDFTVVQLQDRIAIECAHLEAGLEKEFPGFKSNDTGMTIDTNVAVETMRGWRK
jgi:hypothetical protein